MNRPTDSDHASADNLVLALRSLLVENDIRFEAATSRRSLRFVIHGTLTSQWRILVDDDPPCIIACCRLPVAVPKPLAPAAHRIASALNQSQHYGAWSFRESTRRFELRVSHVALPGHSARDAAELCLEVSSALLEGAAAWLSRFALGAVSADVALDRICGDRQTGKCEKLAPFALGINPSLN